jgi:FkbM family methyltransferase
MYKKIEFDTGKYRFKVHIPDWFLTDRGDQGIPFDKLLKDGVLPEISAYKKMHEYMLQFTKEAIFLDIGAHVGLVSIPIAMEGYDVIAIEPVTNDLLSGNARLNSVEDFITIINKAAYDENKGMTIYAPAQDDCTSLSSTLAETGGPLRLVRTEAVILDNLLEKQKIQDRVRFIKIDVQGFEFNVLKGLKKTLALPNERHVLLEWDTAFMKKINTDPNDILSFFSSMGYSKKEWGNEDALFVKI